MHELYVMDISYFSGKMEAYLNYKEIPHRRILPDWNEIHGVILPNTGMMKVPVMKLDDGRWIQDSTPMIEHLEQAYPRFPVLPADGADAFLCRVAEDFADEWLWRPALYYRWHFDRDAELYTDRFLKEFLGVIPLPNFILAMILRSRQQAIYLAGDGVTPATAPHVEKVYTDTLDLMSAILGERDFLTGGKPSLADFGFFASMYRHFYLDPTPRAIMDRRAPLVKAWVERMNRARGSALKTSKFEDGVFSAAPWRNLLRYISATHLTYLAQLTRAWRSGSQTFSCRLTDVTYPDIPVVEYRVWCREILQNHYLALSAAEKEKVNRLTAETGITETLMEDGAVHTGLFSDRKPPFCRPVKLNPLENLITYFTGTHWRPAKS